MGWKDYIIGDDVPKTSPRSNQWWAPSRAVAAGAATLSDWLGSGGKPVPQELANGRAETCAGCPKNMPGDWTSFFTLPAADLIRRQLAKRTELSVSTPLDDRINVCSACYCPLKLKVHCPIEHIQARMPDAVKNELAPDCWVLREINLNQIP